MDEQQTSSKKILILVGGGLLLLLLIGIGIYFFLLKGRPEGGAKSLTSLFGQLGPEVKRPQGGDILPGQSTGDGALQNSTGDEEPLFRQLTKIPVAGATAVTHNGLPVVRFVARENAYIYEVESKTGKTTQLTSTTIPRIQEAYFGNAGNTVVLRYLKRDALEPDVIKTYLAYLSVPQGTQVSSTSPILGTLVGDFLPDNISQVSVSPDGKKLFYLLPVPDGVSGTIVDLASKAAKEVLRTSFSEWLPQLLDNGTIVLTTKPSAKVEGFSYLYNPADKSFSRILRNVMGLTTQSGYSGTRVLFSENKFAKTMLSVYDKKGYQGDEGTKFYTSELNLPTLPEKCVWATNHVRIFCGAVASTPAGDIPDAWYQGTIAFSDMFWTVNTDTSEITFLADPAREPSSNQNFDVLNPFIGKDEGYVFFVNKKDLSLWSMRIQREKYMTTDEVASDEISKEQELTPDEMKDALGSTAKDKQQPKKK